MTSQLQQAELKEQSKKIEELQGRIKAYTAQIKQLDQDCQYKDAEVSHYKKLASELAAKVEMFELREVELDQTITVQKASIDQLKLEFQNLKKELDQQIKQFDSKQKEILKMKDNQMDNEARNDRVKDKEKFFEEEMIALKD